MPNTKITRLVVVGSVARFFHGYVSNTELYRDIDILSELILDRNGKLTMLSGDYFQKSLQSAIFTIADNRSLRPQDPSSFNSKAVQWMNMQVKSLFKNKKIRMVDGFIDRLIEKVIGPNLILYIPSVVDMVYIDLMSFITNTDVDRKNKVIDNIKTYNITEDVLNTVVGFAGKVLNKKLISQLDDILPMIKPMLAATSTTKSISIIHGACCLPYGCKFTTNETCLIEGGIYKGNRTHCGPGEISSCSIRCRLPDQDTCFLWDGQYCPHGWEPC